MNRVNSLYVHVPFCKHLCNYCDFYKQKLTNHKKQTDDFHQALLEGLQVHQQMMNEHGMKWGPIETVYLGGGTPSLWGTDGAAFWKKNINFHLADNFEFTMEVDPGTWTTQMFDAWKEVGLNRLSVGTQSLEPKFLKVLDRVHDLEDSLNLLEYCHKGNWNYSMDFLLGVPFSQQESRDIIGELKTLLRYSPKHISLYILNARSKYPHISSIPDDEYIREEYLAVCDYLSEKGFKHYEVSNFALPGYESRHNLKYWRSESVAALGPTGTGLFFINHEKALRYKWKVSRPEPEMEWLGKQELELEKAYLSLRTIDGWMPGSMNTSLENVIKDWESKRLGSYSNGRVKLNSRGMLILDSLMNDLFKAGL